MDIRLHAVHRGSGDVLILLHGNGDSSEYFFHQIDFFARRFHVIAVDTRGHGKSPRGKAPFTISQFADDLNCFMEDNGIESADILGFSDGGNIALEFALRYGSKVRRLILVGANIFPSGMKPYYIIPITVAFGVMRFLSVFSRRAARRALLLRLMVKEPKIAPGELAAISAPTLVMAGDHDMIKDSHTRLIQRSIPDSKLCILPGDHFIASKNYEAFNRVVADFLDSGKYENAVE